ncbi:hypothetical protein LS74_010410 [Helicobacter magdeburgensis]|uniref:Uncharacterized protein n=1 Tax=Helicobacter magdeburgensis TaxID=471858 RepID=A0A4U8SVX0_9HELI|nr:hypothetical protein [Helicobacter magdeburgensis]TLD91070.1 hypothetical protein LS74_010410 [Helicobacter magdeburgensis]
MADILTQQEINTLLEIADNMPEVDNLAEKITKLMRERDRLNSDIIDLTFRLQNLGYLWARSESEHKTIDIVKLSTRRIVASK